LSAKGVIVGKVLVALLMGAGVAVVASHDILDAVASDIVTILSIISGAFFTSLTIAITILQPSITVGMKGKFVIRELHIYVDFLFLVFCTCLVAAGSIVWGKMLKWPVVSMTIGEFKIGFGIFTFFSIALLAIMILFVGKFHLIILNLISMYTDGVVAQSEADQKQQRKEYERQEEDNIPKTFPDPVAVERSLESARKK